MRILSWNVNGIRAIMKKNFLEWLSAESPDIVCIQETKANDDTIPKALRELSDYRCFVSSAERKGYSGTMILSKNKPNSFAAGIGIPQFDSEGRFSIADYGKFILFNVYFPNGNSGSERLQYKMDFYDAFLRHIDAVRDTGKKIIICGDVNTAHTEIDLARPRQNENHSGFLPEERAWIDRVIEHGYCDTFRIFKQEGGYYSWWDYKTRARERNVGWRIDYFYVSNNLKDMVTDAFILSDVYGSDHCPIGIEINI